MKSDLIDLEMILHHETDGAILVSLDGERAKAVWIPKSACEYAFTKPGARHRPVLVTMPERLAIDKGLV